MAEDVVQTQDTKEEFKKVFGVGFSDVAWQLIGAMDLPIINQEGALNLYSEMSEFDETISTALGFLSYCVVSKLGEYSHPDKRIEDLVRDSINRIHGTIEEARHAAFYNSMVFGFSVNEFTLTVDKGRWLLSSITPYDSRVCQFKMRVGLDNAFEIAQVHQITAGKEIDIPVEKCMILRNGPSGTLYGKSRLKVCRRWYLLKKAIPKFWALALERFGMPIIVGKSTDTEAMNTALSGAYTKTHFAIGPDDDIALLGATVQGGAVAGDTYGLAVSACDKRLYRACFLPALLESGESGGSYSLGQTHFEMFDTACRWFAKAYVEAEIEQVWRRLIDWNFGPQEDYGTIPVTDDITISDKQVLSQIFSSAVNDGYVYPEEGDAEWMREMLALPKAENTPTGEGLWKKFLSSQTSSEDSKTNDINTKTQEPKAESKESNDSNVPIESTGNSVKSVSKKSFTRG